MTPKQCPTCGEILSIDADGIPTACASCGAKSERVSGRPVPPGLIETLHRGGSDGSHIDLSQVEQAPRTLGAHPPQPLGLGEEGRTLKPASRQPTLWGDVVPFDLEPPGPGRAALTRTRDQAPETERMLRATIPGYEILAELGRGGMGVVYKARQLNLNRLVALKMIRAAEAADSSELQRFRTEAKAVAQVQHPNIVQIFHVDEYDGLPFYSMELCPGGALDRKLKGTPLAPREAAFLVEVLARAMGVAHEKGIIHRDLKPANILLAADGTPKITDFGLAKRLDEQGQTQTGSIMGTPSYMAPEQAQGKKEVGAAVDIYSLGSILYELLVGRPPFKADSPIETIQQAVYQDPVSPRQLNPRVPRDLETIALKCLMKDPRRRYETSVAMAEDLHRFLHDQTIRARPTPHLERGVKWVRRRPATAAACTVLVLVALGLVGAGFWYNALLEKEVARAKGEVQTARDELERTNRETDLEKARNYLLVSENLLDAGQWEKSLEPLARVEELLRAGSDSGNLRARLEQSQQRARQKESEFRLADEWSSKKKQLQSHHADALYHATLFTSLGLKESVEETRRAARLGLEPFGLHEEKATVATLPADVTPLCFELLLVLADALIQPLPGDTSEKRQQRASEALAMLDRAGKLNQRSHAFHLRRGQVLEVLGDRVAAVAEGKKAAAIPPESDLDLFLLGESLFRKGRLKEAEVYLERLLRKTPEHFWAHYFLALCGLRQGGAQRERFLEARVHLTTCLSLRELPYVYLMRGLSLSLRDQFAAAEEDFASALEKGDRGVRYGVLINRGEMRLRQGMLAEAETDLLEALKLRPEQSSPRIFLARIYQQKEQQQAARQQLDEALRQGPNAEVYALRARLSEREQPVSALADLDQAVATSTPDSARVADFQLSRGRLLFQLKRYEEAREAATQAIEHTSPPDKLLRASAYRLRGEALLRLRDYARAVDDLSRYLADYKTPAVFEARGLARAKLDDQLGALTDLTRALESSPQAEWYANRAWVYLSFDAPRLALEDFNRAAETLSSKPDIRAGRSNALALVGKVNEALTDVEWVEKSDQAEARDCYLAARTYVLLASRPQVREKAGSSVIEAWLDRAVALLNKAIQRTPPDRQGSFLRDFVLTDPAFQLLARHPEWVRLTNNTR